MNPALPFALDESIFADVEGTDSLRANTQEGEWCSRATRGSGAEALARFEAFDHGAFGVPSFWLPQVNKLFWGQDRMHLLEAYLTAIKLGKPVDKLRNLERFHPRCLRTPPEDRVRKLTFWFDFSKRETRLFACSFETYLDNMNCAGSPWAYLGFSQLERLQRDAGPGLKIELKPFLLGGLFRAIGTPLVPMNTLSEAKRRYNAQDLMDWSAYWDGCNAKEYPPIEGPHLRWPDEFPIRSVTALRVAIIEPKTVPAVYRAAWGDNQRISDEKVLANVLSANGFNGAQLVLAATTGSKAETVKEKLRANTEEAVSTGLCGVSASSLFCRD